MQNQQKHRIGVLNFDLDRWSEMPFNLDEIEADELMFAKKIQSLLETLTSIGDINPKPGKSLR